MHCAQSHRNVVESSSSAAVELMFIFDHVVHGWLTKH